MPVLSQLSKFAQHSVNLQDPPQTNALFIRNNYLGLSPHPSPTIKTRSLKMYSVYSDGFNNKEASVKHFNLTDYNASLFILIDEKYVNDSLPSNNFFLV